MSGEETHGRTYFAICPVAAVYWKNPWTCSYFMLGVYETTCAVRTVQGGVKEPRWRGVVVDSSGWGWVQTAGCSELSGSINLAEELVASREGPFVVVSVMYCCCMIELCGRVLGGGCVTEGVWQVLTVGWQLQDAEFRQPRFVDTSLQIHRQWRRGQMRTFPSAAAAPDLVVRVARGTVRCLQSRMKIQLGFQATSSHWMREMSETVVYRTCVIMFWG